MQPNSSAIQALGALNRRFIHNFVTNDVASHDAMLHPGFRAIYGAGNHIDRVAYLKHWATGFDPDVIPYFCILAQLTSVTPENYPPDDTIVVKYIRGVLQLR